MLRNLKPRDYRDAIIKTACANASNWLRKTLTTEQKIIFENYISLYGYNWWQQFDHNNGGVLGETLRECGFTEDFLGTPILAPIYQSIIVEALKTSPVYYTDTDG